MGGLERSSPTCCRVMVVLDSMQSRSCQATGRVEQIRVAMKKTTVTDAQLLGDLLFGAAQIIGGSRLDDDELIRVAKELFVERQFCIVRHWMLVDVMLPQFHAREIQKQGLEATILFAQQAVFDNQSKHQEGGIILSDYQRDFDGCIFESKDTLYILAGRGARKHASLPAVEVLGDSIDDSSSYTWKTHGN